MTRYLLIASLCGVVACGDDDPSDSEVCTANEPVITCEPTATAECTAETTGVQLAAPGLCKDGLSFTSDAPATFPVGETTVTYTVSDGDITGTCTTVVTVTDTTAPTLDCPDGQEVVRTSPEDATPEIPEATATDSCADTVAVSHDPTELSPGTTTVTYTAEDNAGNTAECDSDITIIDVFAVEGFRIISAELTEGGATNVTLAWEPTTAQAATGYRIERGDAVDGPFAALDTVAVDVDQYTDALPGTEAFYRVVTVADNTDGGITQPKRAFTIATEAYDIRDVPVPNIGFDTTLYGVVRHPADLTAGPFPLIVVLHGNHGNCRSSPEGPNDFCSTTEDHECASAGDFTTPNAEGYIYFLETLAAQGYIAVSISGNAMNCRSDFIIERTNLILEHLRHWASWNVDGDGPFGTTFNGVVDLAKVGLVGHSRGGDAVANAPTEIAAQPIAGVTIESIFAIAPTDFHNAEVIDTDYAVLLPSCDGDVSNLTGMDHYDRSIRRDDGAQRAQVLFIGANHNFFNTEWKLSDNGGGFVCNPSLEAGEQAQMGMLEATLGAWFGATIGEDKLETFVTADADTPTAFDTHAGLDLDLRWSYSAPTRFLIDDFEGANTPDLNDLGGTNTFTDWHELTTQCEETDCDSRFLHEKGAMKLLWRADTMPVATWGLQSYDASAHSLLSFRVVSRRSSLNTEAGIETQEFYIRVYDADGDVAEMLLSDIKTINHLYPANTPREILQTVRIPLNDIVAINPDVDLNALDVLELDMTATGLAGSVIVADIEFVE